MGNPESPRHEKKEYNANSFVSLDMPVKLAQPDVAFHFSKPRQTPVASQASNDDPA